MLFGWLCLFLGFFSLGHANMQKIINMSQTIVLFFREKEGFYCQYVAISSIWDAVLL